VKRSLAFALAAGALEPGDALAVERARCRPGAAARLDLAARELDGEALDGEATSGWGPWLVGDTGLATLGALHMDAGPWQGGDRLPLVLDAALAADARVGVTVHTRAGARVLSPVEGTWLTVGQLRRLEDGRRALDLVLEEQPGLHRVVVEVWEGERRLLCLEAAVRVTEGA